MQPVKKKLLSLQLDKGEFGPRPEKRNGACLLCVCVCDSNLRERMEQVVCAWELIEMRGDVQVSSNIAKPFVRVTSPYSHHIHLLEQAQACTARRD